MSCKFEDCTSLNTVYCYAEEVPSASSQVFSNSPINTATLYVPASSIETYKSTSPWNEFNEIKALPASITLNKAQGTYCFDEDLDFSGVEGIRAYVASGFNPETGTLLLMHVDEVPANTGLLIKGTAGKTYEVPLKETSFYYMNMFKGTLERQTVATTENGYTNYILKDGVFYKSDGTATVGANKAYLQLPTSAAKARQTIRYQTDDEATDINAIDNKVDEADGTFYNMSGQRVNAPRRGIYIQNGKKVIIH